MVIQVNKEGKKKNEMVSAERLTPIIGVALYMNRPGKALIFVLIVSYNTMQLRTLRRHFIRQNSISAIQSTQFFLFYTQLCALKWSFRRCLINKIHQQMAEEACKSGKIPFSVSTQHNLAI